MNGEQWDEVVEEVIKKLDSIDLLSEMKYGIEPIHEFMDRLEEKYPFQYIEAITLFDAFGEEDFKDYLHKRYQNNEEFYTQDYTRTDIFKRR